MSDQHMEEEKTHDKSFIEKISDKIHGHDSSTSPPSPISDSSEDLKSSTNINTSSLKDKVSRLLGREKPLHRVLGGGKPADVFLWRDKKLSGGILGGITAMWVFFDVLEYHVITLLCHALMLGLAILFVWSNATTFISKSSPRIPDMSIPEEPLLKFVSALRSDVNHGLATLREIAAGRELKKFVGVIAGLWVLSVLGSCCDFLTLLYTITVALFTVPLFYEKYEHQIDSLAEKAMVELKKLYAVLDDKVLSKIPRGPLKNKKMD